MPTLYAEVVYENGSKSVIQYTNTNDLQSALQIQNERAKTATPGGPSGFDASRIAKVFLYDTDPSADSDVLNAGDMQKITDAITFPTSAWEVIAAIRAHISPLNLSPDGPQDSMFNAEPTSEMDLTFLDTPVPVSVQRKLARTIQQPQLTKPRGKKPPVQRKPRS